MLDPELDSFKTSVALPAYAAVAHGYQLDRKESWRGSIVMRHPNGDKIIIKRDAGSGHYVYFSVRDDNDNGTIIDFLKHTQSLTLGAIRKELRPWIGMPPVPTPTFPELHPTTRDRVRVEAEYERMKEASYHPYLENERRIPRRLLRSKRFEGRIRLDRHGNAIFPHEDKDGLCGFEKKNHGYTSFSAGGTKAIWMSNVFPDDDRLVLCEAAIDALSYAALFPNAHTRYGSIGGKLNPAQPALIRDQANVMPAHSIIVAAMDADVDGRKLAEVVREAVRHTGRADLRFEMHEPEGYKDWNDQIRGKRRDFFPAAQVSGLEMK
jgi:Toprim-like/Protein of unknown function (DUF3991)